MGHSSNNTVEYVTATNRARGIYLRGDSDGNTIQHNDLSGASGYPNAAIALWDDASGNTIQQNDLSGSWYAIDAAGNRGLGNRYLNNNLSDSQGFFMRIAYDTQVEVAGNDITNVADGLGLLYMDGITLSSLSIDLFSQLGTVPGIALGLTGVTNSLISGLDLSWSGAAPSGNGVYMGHSSNNTIEHVTATNRVIGVDISANSEGDSFAWSTFSDNETGLRIRGTNHRVESSSILNNTVGVQVAWGADGIAVNENHIEGNLSAGVSNSAEAWVNAENNYWGSPDGPYPIGTGDTIIGNVDAEPFLTGAPGVDTTPPGVLGVDVGEDLNSLIVQLNDDDLDDAGATQPGNYKVTAANGDADGNGDPFDDGDESEMAIDSIAYDPAADRIMLRTVDLLFTDFYRLELDGDDAISDGTPGITDLAGNFINGGDFAAVLDTTVLADPAVRAQGLIETVLDLSLSHGTENSLVAKLDGALEKLDDGNPNNDHAALGKLDAFINQVEAQRGKKISEDDADTLIAEASLIIQLLEDDLL